MVVSAYITRHAYLHVHMTSNYSKDSSVSITQHIYNILLFIAIYYAKN